MRRDLLALVLLLPLLWACPGGGDPAAPGGASSPGAEAEPEVVVYCALDRLYAQPLLEAFERERGVKVAARWDTEATKTTGLVEAIRAERERPRCDVLWNNEVGQTVLLADEGLLEPYTSPSAAGVPASARDPEGRWTGFAARARVLIVNSELVAEADTPRSTDAYLDPRWRGKAGIAKPLFGTTATHLAALWALEGPEATRRWVEGALANGAVVCAGNATVKDRVAAGELAWGLTDTDDANLALLAGKPVRVVFPDQEPGQRGTLVLPNTVAVVRGAPHPQAARALVDYLLRPEVEAALARSRSAQIPLRPGIERPAWIPADVRSFEVTWAGVAAAFPAARAFAEERFLGAGQ